MPQTLKDIMTTNPVTCSTDAQITDVARLMKERDIGNVIVLEGDTVAGIVTDRDIVIRAVAESREGQTTIGEITTRDIATLSPDDDVKKAFDISAAPADD